MHHTQKTNQITRGFPQLVVLSTTGPKGDAPHNKTQLHSCICERGGAIIITSDVAVVVIAAALTA